jgi:hypothetical protein
MISLKRRITLGALTVSILIAPSYLVANSIGKVRSLSKQCEGGKQNACLELDKIALEDKDAGVRRLATDAVTDQTLLAKIALDDGDASVRAAAVAKVVSQSLLAKIAVEDKDASVRKAAGERLSAQTSLSSIAVAGQPAVVHASAVEKQDELAPPNKEAAKQAAKALNHVQDEAYNAIGHGRIEQLKAILEANPGIASLPLKSSKLAAAVGVAVVPLAVIGTEGVKRAQQDSPAVVGVIGDVVDSTRGVTLLHWAAWFNKKDAAELLLEYHAKINARDGSGYTPLHQGILGRSWDVVRFLIDQGADVNAVANNGDTPLKVLDWEAFSTGGRNHHPYVDIQALLIQHGAR